MPRSSIIMQGPSLHYYSSNKNKPAFLCTTGCIESHGSSARTAWPNNAGTTDCRPKKSRPGWWFRGTQAPVILGPTSRPIAGSADVVVSRVDSIESHRQRAGDRSVRAGTGCLLRQP